MTARDFLDYAQAVLGALLAFHLLRLGREVDVLRRELYRERGWPYPDEWEAVGGTTNIHRPKPPSAINRLRSRLAAWIAP